MTPHQIHTRTTTCYLGEDGIVRLITDPQAEETLADAQANVRAVATIGKQRRPLLVDMRQLKSQSREARTYYGSTEVAKTTSAIALLIGSRVSTIIANFVISLTKSNIPTKLFTDETEALAWLKGFLP